MKYLTLHHSQYNRGDSDLKPKNGFDQITRVFKTYWYVIAFILGIGLGIYAFNYFVLPFGITRNTIVGYNLDSKFPKTPFSSNNPSQGSFAILANPGNRAKFHDVTITSTSYLVYDLNSNWIVDSKNVLEKRSIASITKAVTALVVLDTYSLTSTITIKQSIPKVDRTLGLMVGDKVNVNELLNAMLVYSANDAAIIFANEYPNGGYTGFITAMNTKAKELGMTSSHFSNPSGFYDEDNYSTAKDLLKLALVTSGEDRITKITSKPAYTFNFESKAQGRTVSQTLISTDELLPANKYVKGIKTGFTYASGPSFMSYWVKEDRKYLIIVMNSQDRFGESLRLFNQSIKL